MYFGKSNNCNRHIFYLKEGSLGNVAPVDVDKKIEDALKKKDQDYLIKSLQEQVEQQSEYIEQLEEVLEELSSKTDIRGIIKEGAALLGVLKNTPNTKTALSGVESESADAEVKVEPVAESDIEESEDVSKEAFEEVYQQFGKKGTDQIIGLMVRISNSDELRKGINDLLEKENIKNEKEVKTNSS